MHALGRACSVMHLCCAVPDLRWRWVERVARVERKWLPAQARQLHAPAPGPGIARTRSQERVMRILRDRYARFAMPWPAAERPAVGHTMHSWRAVGHSPHMRSHAQRVAPTAERGSRALMPGGLRPVRLKALLTLPLPRHTCDAGEPPVYRRPSSRVQADTADAKHGTPPRSPPPA